MTLRSTSIYAYESVLADLGNRQKRVFHVIKTHGPATNLELSVILGWPINCITPRTLELREAGLVVEAEQRECKVSKRTSIAWRLKTAEEITKDQVPCPSCKHPTYPDILKESGEEFPIRACMNCHWWGDDQ